MTGFLERQGLKALGWRLRRMDWFKRWGPFGGSVITVVCAFLKATGYAEAADAILGVVAFVLPVADTPEQALATTAATSAVGLALQLWSRWQKAKAPAGPVTIPAKTYHTKEELDAAIAAAFKAAGVKGAPTR